MDKGNKMNRDLIKVESRLQKAFQPILPPSGFVEELRILLDQEMVKKTKTKKMQKGLLVAGGIVGLAVMVITIIRSLTSLGSSFRTFTKNLPKLRKQEPVASI